MVTLIIGGSGSGKSAWAEDYITAIGIERSGGVRAPAEKYYVATMRAEDGESEERTRRHRRQRDGKGFVTIEQQTDIQRAAERMMAGRKIVLLECISNLAANEMFAGATPEGEEAVVEKIVGEIAEMKEKVTDLVLVSNNVFEDGKIYDRATMAYIRAMGKINEKLAAMADEVIEVVVGIPVVIKEKRRGAEGSCMS